MSRDEAIVETLKNLKDEQEVEAWVKYKELEFRVKGRPESVAREIQRFLAENIPAFELASKLSVSVDMHELMEASAGVLLVTAEGIVVTADVGRLTDKELILLHLYLARLKNFIGLSAKDSALSLELAEATKLRTGTLAGRLSELTAEGCVERLGKGEYRITTYGLLKLKQETLPKLRVGAR